MESSIVRWAHCVLLSSLGLAAVLEFSDLDMEHAEQEAIGLLACAVVVCEQRSSLMSFWESLAAANLKDGISEVKGTMHKWMLCAQSCQDRPAGKSLGVDPPNAEELAAVQGLVGKNLQAFWSQQKSCLQEYQVVVASTVDANDLAAMLRRCGMVRVRGLWSPKDPFLAELESQFRKLRGNGSVANLKRYGRVELSQSGRARRRTEDILLRGPRRIWEQSAARLVTEPLVIGGLAGYFGRAPRLSYASWIAAPRLEGKVESQTLHSDIAAERTMASVHLALHDVGLEDGATTFCLGSHTVPTEGMDSGFAAATKIYAMMAGRLSERQRRLFCRGLLHGVADAGDVTVYDSALYHFGTANTGRDLRTVFNLNVAGNAEVIAEENYTKHFDASDAAAQETLRSLAWMREAFDQPFFAEVIGASSSALGSVAARLRELPLPVAPREPFSNPLELVAFLASVVGGVVLIVYAGSRKIKRVIGETKVAGKPRGKSRASKTGESKKSR